MQQTQTYKLNLLETSDAFSPSPLNENMEKVETKLAALDGTAADHETRITALEVKKMVVGTYAGNGSYGKGSQGIELGFSPLALIVCGYNYTSVALRGSPNSQLEITETGFVAHNGSNGMHFNNYPSIYNYIAFA